MDEPIFKSRVQRLQEVNKVIAKLDPAIRVAAFETLREYVTGVKTAPPPGGKPGSRPPIGSSSSPGDTAVQERLLADHPDRKPSENAVIAAAIWFSEYGTNPFDCDALRGIAAELGLTLPDRPDVTVRSATRDKKPLFKSAGRGKYAPTVHGRTYLKNTYNVTQGKAAPPDKS